MGIVKSGSPELYRAMAAVFAVCALIGLLLDIQTANEIADVIGEYLGDRQVAHTFAKRFVEKRKIFQKTQPMNNFPVRLCARVLHK